MTESLSCGSDELAGLAEPVDYVEAVEDGYRQHGKSAAEPRTKLINREPPGMLTGYLAILPESGYMGGYTYSAGFGERDAWFMTPLFDAESGEPLALFDGASMNLFKTGAAGAVAVDHLARDDSETVGIIGSGPQARGQLLSTATVRDLSEVRVYSPTEANREAFATEMTDRLDCELRAVDTSAQAVTNADIVITATTADEPVFDGEQLAPGTHVTAMGQYSASKRELDTTTIERSTYVPDLRERVMQDAGSFICAVEQSVVDESHIHAELGEIVAGKTDGRTSADEITVFDSGGTGIETVAAAGMLYERAQAEEIGSTISFAPASEALTGR